MQARAGSDCLNRSVVLGAEATEGRGLMRMVPDRPMPSTASAAERRVFELLEATPMPGATAFHSLWIGRHSEKVSAEGDFVIIRDDAVLVIEVKGGRVRREGGR